MWGFGLMQAMRYYVRSVQGLQIVGFGHMRFWSLVVESLTCFSYCDLRALIDLLLEDKQV